MPRALVCAAFLSLAAFGQTADRFEAADVRVSPHSENNFKLNMRGPQIRAGRYEIHTATMADLISTAYGVEFGKVFGGPNWLELDRYDITAKLPPGATPASQKKMLQALLAERFHLVVHPDSKESPAYLLTAAKHPLLKDADPSAAKGCQDKPRPQNVEPTYPNEVVCHGLTTAEFADNLQNMASGYLRRPVVDATGLKGTYDFDLRWTGRGQLAAAGADGISVFDAVERQLGLKLDLQSAPQPVIDVESVDEKPTPNPPDVASIIPGVAVPTHFEVAEVKVMAPGDQARRLQLLPSGRVDIEGVDLKFIIEQLWNLNEDMVVDAPKWLTEEKFSIVAKAPSTSVVKGENGPPIDIDSLIDMVKNLLADRFKLQTHMEERPMNAYTLTAVKPKLKAADPNGRIRCDEGPSLGQKDVRDSQPILGRLLNCQNVSMARFAAMLQSLAPGYIHAPVLDATGLQGAFDFSFSFSTVGQLRAGRGGDAAPTDASDPNGAVSLPDAIAKQLGLKLEMTKRPVQVLVIDHVEPKPTEN